MYYTIILCLLCLCACVCVWDWWSCTCAHVNCVERLFGYAATMLHNTHSLYTVHCHGRTLSILLWLFKWNLHFIYTIESTQLCQQHYIASSFFASKLGPGVRICSNVDTRTPHEQQNYVWCSHQNWWLQIVVSPLDGILLCQKSSTLLCLGIIEAPTQDGKPWNAILGQILHFPNYRSKEWSFEDMFTIAAEIVYET